MLDWRAMGTDYGRRISLVASRAALEVGQPQCLDLVEAEPHWLDAHERHARRRQGGHTRGVANHRRCSRPRHGQKPLHLGLTAADDYEHMPNNRNTARALLKEAAPSPNPRTGQRVSGDVSGWLALGQSHALAQRSAP
jgi:hypothetical protein